MRKMTELGREWEKREEGCKMEILQRGAEVWASLYLVPYSMPCQAIVPNVSIRKYDDEDTCSALGLVRAWDRITASSIARKTREAASGDWSDRDVLCLSWHPPGRLGWRWSYARKFHDLQPGCFLLLLGSACRRSRCSLARQTRFDCSKSIVRKVVLDIAGGEDTLEEGAQFGRVTGSRGSPAVVLKPAGEARSHELFGLT